MTIKEFINFHKAKSIDFPIFNSPEAIEFALIEKKVTDDEIKAVEKSIGCKLPENYTAFCKEYGGGYFGLAIIHSLDENGELYIGKIINDFSYFLPEDLIPFCDDECGGFYCFKIRHGIATEEMCYIDSAGLINNLNYSDFFAFVIDTAYPK